MNIGAPEDKFDEEKIEREEILEELEKLKTHETKKEEFNDQLITEIIEIFAREIDGAYYGKYGEIGPKEKCIEWVRDILKGSGKEVEK